MSEHRVIFHRNGMVSVNGDRVGRWLAPGGGFWSSQWVFTAFDGTVEAAGRQSGLKRYACKAYVRQAVVR